MKNTGRLSRKIRTVRKFAYLGMQSLKKDGIWITAGKVLRVLGLGRTLAYRRWAEKPLYTEAELQAQRERVFDGPVTFSIITPLYNTREEYLRDAIESVRAQTYPGWELCLADGSDEEHDHVGRICREYAEKDPRIKYRKLEDNYGIVGNSNACIQMAEGEYISILDHDDVLHPAALYDVMEAVEEKSADFVYTDEFTFRESNLKSIALIHFKKDYAPDDMRANNYICHFTSFRRDLLDHCGVFRQGFDGSQDHDLFLRLTARAQNIVHVPKPLYYWRAHGESVAQFADNKSYAGEAGKRAVRESLKAAGIPGSVDGVECSPTIYRVSYDLPSEEPSVCILIPNYDHVEDLRLCIDSILRKTTYTNYEIVIIENNSRKTETFDYYREITERNENIRVITWPGTGFNWSGINNYAVRSVAEGEYLLFLNNDIEVITPDWIQEMLMHAQRPEIGAVGAMLYFPNDTVQHAGVIIGLGGVAGHIATGFRRGDPGYMGRLSYAQNLSAVTGACLMVRRSVFQEVDGFWEELAVGFNDIDFCLKLREAGYLNLWTPHAELYHYESKSRGVYDTAEDRERSEKERDLFAKRWAGILEEGDPYYNINLTLNRSNFEPK